MGEGAFDADILSENLRCKVIYYSCINSHTIADLNEAWRYNSPTYLYQNDALEKLEQTGMIRIEKDAGKNIISSNYAILFDDAVIQERRQAINKDILKEYLLHSKGFHPSSTSGVDMDTLLEMGHENLDASMQDDVDHLQFDENEFSTMTALWRTSVFKEIFLSLDILVKIVGEQKDQLPDNPIDHMFRITAGLMTSLSRGQEGQQEMRVPQDLRYRAEKIIVPAFRKLENQQDTEDYDEFVATMKDTYSLFRAKFRDERFNYDFIDDFIDLTIKEESEKKLGKLLKKYRGDSSLF